MNRLTDSIYKMISIIILFIAVLTMYFSLFLLCVTFSLSTSDTSTSSYSLLTDETCMETGLWTIWIDVYNSNRTTGDNVGETYNILYNTAKQICSSPLMLQIDQPQQHIQKRSVFEDAIFSAFLSYYASLLKDKDFRFRFCCATDSYATTESVELETDATMEWTDETWTDTITETWMETTTETAATMLTAPDGAICGKQAIAPRPSLTSRIFGGTDAIAHSWPWMIDFRQITQCPQGGLCYIGCGGTIISKNYVLTAAHCINTNIPSNIKLTAGMHQQSSRTENNTRQVRQATSIHIHPQFNDVSMINDIALLRVNPPFDYTTYVQPACLSNIDPQVNDKVVIIGWGSESLQSSSVDILKQAYTQVVGDCWRYWSAFVSQRQMCIANTDTGDSACKGDSGGPILEEINGQYIVSGIASFTHACKTKGYDTTPNVYTRVSAYQSWMKNIINKN